MNRQQRRQAERAARKGPPPPSRTSVVIGYLHTDEVAAEFCASLHGLLQHDARHHGYVSGPGAAGGIIDIRSGPRVAEGRTQMVEHFLTSPQYDAAEWLLMLDSDMAFDADLLDRLMTVASFPEVPIVGGLAIAGRHYGQQWPTIYEMYEEGETWGVKPIDVTRVPEDALVKCGGTGAACLLVHRQAYMGMAVRFHQLADGRLNPYPWFVEGLTDPNGAPLGEDIAFCRKATICGIPIHVHTGVLLGHMKSAPMTLQTARAQAEENLPTALELDNAEIVANVDQAEFEKMAIG